MRIYRCNLWGSGVNLTQVYVQFIFTVASTLSSFSADRFIFISCFIGLSSELSLPLIELNFPLALIAPTGIASDSEKQRVSPRFYYSRDEQRKRRFIIGFL